MKFVITLLTAVVAFGTSAQASVARMIAASKENGVVAHASRQEGETLLGLALTGNEALCRPAFSTSPFAKVPVIADENGVTIIRLALFVGSNCGEGSGVERYGVSKTPISIHRLKDVVKSFETNVPYSGVKEYLASHPGVLDSGKIEYQFLLQYFAPGAHDSSLVVFNVREVDLSDESTLVYASPEMRIDLK